MTGCACAPDVDNAFRPRRRTGRPRLLLQSLDLKLILRAGNSIWPPGRRCQSAGRLASDAPKGTFDGPTLFLAGAESEYCREPQVGRSAPFPAGKDPVFCRSRALAACRPPRRGRRGRRDVSGLNVRTKLEFAASGYWRMRRATKFGQRLSRAGRHRRVRCRSSHRRNHRTITNSGGDAHPFSLRIGHYAPSPAVGQAPMASPSSDMSAYEAEFAGLHQ